LNPEPFPEKMRKKKNFMLKKKIFLLMKLEKHKHEIRKT